MPTRYLLLRTDTPFERDLDPTNATAWRARRTSTRHLTPVTELAVEIVDGHERNLAELRADPQNLAVVDADVALALVAPRARAQPNPGALRFTGTVKMPDGLIGVGAHSSPYTGQGTTVAVLDTGIDADHPSFQGKAIAKRNFTGDGPQSDVSDADGHGTHCAGIICGVNVGELRVGVAPGVAKLCVGKVLSRHGCTLEMLINGMLWAVLREKATIVSMSLSYDLPGNTKRLVEAGMKITLATQAALRQQREVAAAIRTLRAFLESRVPSLVFVAAAGNESERPAVVLDAGLPAVELISVGAVGPTGSGWTIAEFSNGLAHVVAPGVNVVSAAVGGGFTSMSGTSMATPHVAGVAALWAEKLRNDGTQEIPGGLLSSLKASAILHPLVDRDPHAVGMGMVQAPQS